MAEAVPDVPPYDDSAPVLRFLTKAIHVSSPFITTFLLIHLSAPVMGLGGSTLASQTMVCYVYLYKWRMPDVGPQALGREYY
jgi:hypothetical protein